MLQVILTTCALVGFATYMFWHWVGASVCRYVLCPVLMFIGKRRAPYHLEGYMDRHVILAPTDWIKGWWVRVHVIKRSDEDRALHDHPGDNWSLILWGSYKEHTPMFDVKTINEGWCARPEPTMWRRRGAGEFVSRKGDERHRLVLDDGVCITLFIMRVKPKREWGFYDWVDGEFQWVHWTTYNGSGGELAREAAHVDS